MLHDRRGLPFPLPLTPSHPRLIIVTLAFMDDLFVPPLDVQPAPTLHIPTEVCENVIDMLYSARTSETLINIPALHI